MRRANPLTKLALLLPVLAALPFAPAWALAAVGAAGVAAAFAAGVGGAVLRRLLLLLSPLALALVAIHGVLLPQGEGVPLGPLHYYPQGLARAALVLSRLFAVIPVALLAVMTTPAAAFADALEAAGVSAALAFLLTAPLAMTEAIALEGQALRDALQLRGVAVRGGPLRQVRALMQIVTPLVRAQLIDAGPRARALEARGFGALPRRSLLEPPPDSPAQRRLRWLLLLSAALIVAAGLL